MTEKIDVLLVGEHKSVIINGLSGAAHVHLLEGEKDPNAFLASIAGKIKAIAVAYTSHRIDAAFMQQFPLLKIVSTFGVGYDHVDTKWARQRGVIVTNTPEVLNEEVADTAVALLLATIRELPQADHYVRSGKWPEAAFRLSGATLRDRTIGMVGMGRIGQAIARRLDAFGVPVVYHSRNPQTGVGYKYYPSLVDMARDVDTLMVIVPGGAATKNLINAEVLKALGPRGILINIARGSVVDEPALIEALKSRTIYAAGLDVFADEPNVPRELVAMDHVVLLPHIGSASRATRAAMDQIVVDNILAWASGKPPLTPVPETPYPPNRP